MVQVVWSPEALLDLSAIRDHIGADRPLAGQRMAVRLEAAANALSGFPLRGRPASAGLRELAVIYPYLIRYRVRSGSVQIVRIKHGAQRPG